MLPFLPSRLAALLIGLLLGATAFAQDEDPESTRQGRESYLGREIARTMHWTGADWLLRETRDNEENGARLREWLDLQPGDVVCDFGCGNGYHTLPMAKAVGETGKVFAVDLQVPMLAMLRERLTEAEITNVELVEADIDDPKLPENSCDVILMVDVYHELSHPVRVLDHIRRALKPGGRVVLGNFHPRNPTRALMEHVLDWRLIHRTEADMDRLFAASRFGRPASRVRFEPSGVNLFAECVRSR